MESYDVIIVGGGIAGTGLSYFLSQECPEKNVLLIDKNQIGSNKGYGYRNTFKEIIDELNIPYDHKYKGFKVGALNETIATIDQDFYFFEYKRICDNLFTKSNTVFKKEAAVDVVNSKLITNKSEYNFKYLVDCSGPSLFLKKILKMPLPFKYWLGHLHSLKNNISLESDYFFLGLDDLGFLEDIYPFQDKLLHGYWRYTKKIDFSLIKPIPKATFYKMNIKKPIVISNSFAIQTVSPALPLVYRNYVSLGDSFGNATPMVGEGIKPIIQTAKMLTKYIKINDLRSFQKEWKKLNLNYYIWQLALRSDIKNRLRIINLFKNDTDMLSDLFKKKQLKIPLKVKKKIPKKILLNILSSFLFFKLKYSLLNLKYGYTKYHKS